MRKNIGIGLKNIKKINKSMMLKLIWENDNLSRIDIADRLELSPATITSLCDELIKEGMIIEESIGESSGGRRPILLRINPEGGYIFTIIVDATSLEFSLYNLAIKRVYSYEKSITEDIEIQKLYEKMVKGLDKISDELNIDKAKIIGIGIAFKNNYRYIDKHVVMDTGISMGRLNLTDALSFIYKTPVILSDVVDAKAIAEYYFRNVKIGGNYIYIDINEKINISIVKDGSPVKSDLYENNEISHMVIDRNGPKCICGRKGCLYVFASTASIVKKIMAGMIYGRKTMISQYSDNDIKNVNFDTVTNCANLGDEYTREVISEAADAVMIALLNLISLFNCKNVIVAGKITKINYFMDELKKAAEKYQINGEEIALYQAELSDDFLSSGLAALVAGNYFNNIYFGGEM